MAKATSKLLPAHSLFYFLIFPVLSLVPSRQNQFFVLIHIPHLILNFAGIITGQFMTMSSILLGFVGPWQIALIVVVILLLFGGRKIPELMRGLGGGIKEFKSAVKDDEPEEHKADQKEDNAPHTNSNKK